MSETTKVCSKCGSTTLQLLSSQKIKICYDCGNKMPWELAKGQKSILTDEVGK